MKKKVSGAAKKLENLFVPPAEIRESSNEIGPDSSNDDAAKSADGDGSSSIYKTCSGDSNTTTSTSVSEEGDSGSNEILTFKDKVFYPETIASAASTLAQFHQPPSEPTEAETSTPESLTSDNSQDQTFANASHPLQEKNLDNKLDETFAEFATLPTKLPEAKDPALSSAGIIDATASNKPKPNSGKPRRTIPKTKHTKPTTPKFDISELISDLMAMEQDDVDTSAEKSSANTSPVVVSTPFVLKGKGDSPATPSLSRLHSVQVDKLDAEDRKEPTSHDSPLPVITSTPFLQQSTPKQTATDIEETDVGDDKGKGKDKSGYQNSPRLPSRSRPVHTAKQNIKDTEELTSQDSPSPVVESTPHLVDPEPTKNEKEQASQGNRPLSGRRTDEIITPPATATTTTAPVTATTTITTLPKAKTAPPPSSYSFGNALAILSQLALIAATTWAASASSRNLASMAVGYGYNNAAGHISSSLGQGTLYSLAPMVGLISMFFDNKKPCNMMLLVTTGISAVCAYKEGNIYPGILGIAATAIGSATYLLNRPKEPTVPGVM